VVDSTGAGDAFVAVFAHSVLGGQTLLRSALAANAAGVLSATSVGAQTRTITAAELVALLPKEKAQK